jgi:hypothetical protein
MSKEITWEELLKERYSEKSEKKKENTEIRGFQERFQFQENEYNKERQ